MKIYITLKYKTIISPVKEECSINFLIKNIINVYYIKVRKKGKQVLEDFNKFEEYNT